MRPARHIDAADYATIILVKDLKMAGGRNPDLIAVAASGRRATRGYCQSVDKSIRQERAFEVARVRVKRTYTGTAIARDIQRI